MSKDDNFKCNNSEDEKAQEKALIKDIDACRKKMDLIKKSCQDKDITFTSEPRDSKIGFLLTFHEKDKWIFLQEEVKHAFDEKDYNSAFTLVYKALDHITRESELCLSSGDHAFHKEAFLKDKASKIPGIGTFFFDKADVHASYEQGLKQTAERLTLIKDWIDELENYFCPGLFTQTLQGIQTLFSGNNNNNASNPSTAPKPGH